MTPTLSPKPVQIKVNNTLYYILELHGTIPVLYQGVTYQIPIKIQISMGYPNYPPLLMVTPVSDMVIKASEYVREDGTGTLEILRLWNNRCTLQHLIEEAKKCFAHKMPVYKKPKGAPPSSNNPNNPGQAYPNANYPPAGYPPTNYPPANAYPPGS